MPPQSPLFKLAVSYLDKHVDDLGLEASEEEDGAMFSTLGGEYLELVPAARGAVRVAAMLGAESRDFLRLNFAAKTLSLGAGRALRLDEAYELAAAPGVGRYTAVAEVTVADRALLLRLLYRLARAVAIRDAMQTESEEDEA